MAEVDCQYPTDLPEPDWAKPKQQTTKPAKAKPWLESIKKTAFILVTALICFAAARNTITWHVNKLWGASGEFWQSCWKKVLLSVGEDEFILFTFGTFIVPFVTYWVQSCLYLYIDITGRPQWALKYKIQDGQNMPVDRGKLIKAIKCVLLNQFIGLFFGMAMYNLFIWRGMSFGAELPTFQWALFEFAMFLLVEEVGFYYSHRLFHHPKIYKYIHKQHHEWTSPIGVVAFYCHPLEHVISNLSPSLLGPLIMGSHIATTLLWCLFAMSSSVRSHSGYHFPYLPSPEAHDFHHLKFNENYGVLGVLDRLHGTDTLFRNSVCYDRHILMIGLHPVSEVSEEDDLKKNICKKSE